MIQIKKDNSVWLKVDLTHSRLTKGAWVVTARDPSLTGSCTKKFYHKSKKSKTGLKVWAYNLTLDSRVLMKRASQSYGGSVGITGGQELND